MANFPTLGMELHWSASTAASTANAIGQVINISGPSGSAPSIDVTHLGSAAREFIMGLRNEGEITLDVIFDPSDGQQATAWIDRNSRNKKAWVIKFSTWGADNRKYLRSKGYMTGFNITNNMDDVMRASLTILIASAVSLTSALS